MIGVLPSHFLTDIALIHSKMQIPLVLVLDSWGWDCCEKTEVDLTKNL